MSIRMYTGRPGTGKTYLLTRDVLKELKKGTKVYSNYKIQGDWPTLKYWKRLDDLYKLEDGIIVMDEAHVYMRSRKWESLPEEMERKLAQHRKDGLHIWGTVQAVERIDKIFRELIDYWYVCESTWFFFIRWEFDIDQDKMKKYPLSKRYYLKRKKIYDSYDTLEKISVTK